MPAGALVDGMRDKRWAVWFGTLSISGTALMYALSPTQMSVYVAEVLHGLASSVIGPAIAAVSLALVGRAAFSERIGRNARFAADRANSRAARTDEYRERGMLWPS